MGDRKVVRLSKLEDPNGDEFTLQLSLSMPYDAVTAAIGEKIGADGKFIRLTAHSTFVCCCTLLLDFFFVVCVCVCV